MPCDLTNGRGETYRFGISIDAVVAYEESHPEWSLMDDIDGMGSRLRLSTIDRLCRFIGYSYTDFVNLGFGIEDLGEIYARSMQDDLGFPKSGSSSEGPDSV